MTKRNSSMSANRKTSSSFGFRWKEKKVIFPILEASKKNNLAISAGCPSKMFALFPKTFCPERNLQELNGEDQNGKKGELNSVWTVSECLWNTNKSTRLKTRSNHQLSNILGCLSGHAICHQELPVDKADVSTSNRSSQGAFVWTVWSVKPNVTSSVNLGSQIHNTWRIACCCVTASW